MLILLIVLLVLLLAGGGWGYNAGHVAWGNPLGIILFILLIMVIFGLVGGPRFGWY